MAVEKDFDVCIAGGGLAGLSLSILLAQKSYNVALIEKEQYPFHRVCGEYISNESWQFVKSLGVPLETMELPKINKLKVSSPSGIILECLLSMGGFGISRYLLDHQLSNIARNSGVTIFENTKVSAITFTNGRFYTTTPNMLINSTIAIGSFGKRSNLDVKLERSFIKIKRSKLNNYIGVKYHIKGPIEEDTIALHNFEDGYCGISKIENDKYCLCYLTSANNLKKSKNSIKIMEENILCKNPYLKDIFSKCQKVFSIPITISQISFDKKEIAKDNIIMIGDAAGLITPLSGNGMSMAFRSAQIAADLIEQFLKQNITIDILIKNYKIHWVNEFSKRLKTGRFIQSLFGKSSITNIFVSVMKQIPFLTKYLIQKTHGKTF